LRKIFDPAALQALEGLWQKIESEALTPLFLAGPEASLVQAFQRVYPHFAAYYLGATLALITSLKEPQLVGEVVAHSFEVLQHSLSERGPEHLGREATLAALIGVHSMMGALKAAARQLVEEPAQREQQREQLEAIAAQWTVGTTAYMLTIFAVSYALSQGKEFAGPWQNVATLARWSQAYAGQVYDLSTRTGLLRPPARPPGTSPSRSTEEEVQLANAGLEDYARLLEHLEQG